MDYTFNTKHVTDHYEPRKVYVRRNIFDTPDMIVSQDYFLKKVGKAIKKGFDSAGAKMSQGMQHTFREAIVKPKMQKTGFTNEQIKDFTSSAQYKDVSNKAGASFRDWGKMALIAAGTAGVGAAASGLQGAAAIGKAGALASKGATALKTAKTGLTVGKAIKGATTAAGIVKAVQSKDPKQMAAAGLQAASSSPALKDYGGQMLQNLAPNAQSIVDQAKQSAIVTSLQDVRNSGNIKQLSGLVKDVAPSVPTNIKAEIKNRGKQLVSDVKNQAIGTAVSTGDKILNKYGLERTSPAMLPMNKQKKDVTRQLDALPDKMSMTGKSAISFSPGLIIGAVVAIGVVLILVLKK